MAQPHRLAAAPSHKFSGSEIDRSRRIGFRLNGRSIEAHPGDTVLSAALAAGITTLGLRHGEPIALSERFAPAVLPAGAPGDLRAAMPMERLPALAGLDLVTLGGIGERLTRGGPLSRLRHLLLGQGPSLGLRIEERAMLEGQWRDLPVSATLETDTVVIGGGVAGMSAAQAAAAAGDKVVLLERSPAMGGDARYFGTLENEEPPAASIHRLAAALVQAPDVTVLTRADAFSIAGTTVLAHHIECDGTAVRPRTIAVTGKRIVLATGMLERLPVFPGNRAPGVVAATSAYRLAIRYGVWAGRKALFSTSNNYGYRLGLRTRDAGVEVQRIADTRLDPQSRFLDFVKASGITLAAGLAPRAAAAERGRPGGLSVRFGVAVDEQSRETDPILTDRFVVGGNWQPELSLWLLVGGGCAWDSAAGWLAATGRREGIALAGSAAGWRNNSACMTSGAAAVAALLGRAVPPIDDHQIDSMFETPDGHPAPSPLVGAGRSRAWLGGGFGFAAHGSSSGRRDRQSVVSEPRQSLDIEEVAGAVQAGELPPEEAGSVAAERCRGPAVLADSGWRPQPPAQRPSPDDPLPPWLAGRFGARPQVLLVGTADARALETGCLLYPNSDETDPARAVGVVIGPPPGSRAGGLALVQRAMAGSTVRLFARDSGGAVPLERREKVKSG